MISVKPGATPEPQNTHGCIAIPFYVQPYCLTCLAAFVPSPR